MGSFPNTNEVGFTSDCKCANGCTFDVLNTNEAARKAWSYDMGHKDNSCLYPWRRACVVLSGNTDYPAFTTNIYGKRTNFGCVARDLCTQTKDGVTRKGKVGTRLYRAPTFALKPDCVAKCKSCNDNNVPANCDNC